ncbi:MAG: sirohydrochlorin cobaltochelatase [Acidaminococcaceae bacterium]|nr:sirohydrochlorin cobaltochelatase [Acidaminococcaceae bacterium]
MNKAVRIVTNVLLSVCGMAFAVPGHAGYKLSSEVKKPTPALLEASEIGVRVYNNREMQDLPDKDALVVMSFGTTMKETRDRTINATVEEIRKALPGVKVLVAYTSHIIIDRIKAKEGLVIPTPEEALEQLKAEGYTRIALASLDIIPGMEYDYKCGIFRNYRTCFKKMTMGLPLLFWQGQENQRDDVMETVQAFATQFPKLESDEALLVMTHGTPHPSNAYYAVIQDRLNKLGKGHIHVYSVEGMPMLEHVIPELKKEGVTHVTLMPMMMVAGDHANNDMAGDEDDSHKVILQNEGFSVTPYIHGMGENPAVREIFVERALESWETLQNVEEGRTGGMPH